MNGPCLGLCPCQFLSLQCPFVWNSACFGVWWVTYARFSRRPDVFNPAKDPDFLSAWLQTLMWQGCPWWVCVYIVLLLHTSPHSLCNLYAQYIIIKPYSSADEMKLRLQSKVDIQYCNSFLISKGSNHFFIYHHFVDFSNLFGHCILMF